MIDAVAAGSGLKTETLRTEVVIDPCQKSLENIGEIPSGTRPRMLTSIKNPLETILSPNGATAPLTPPTTPEKQAARNASITPAGPSSVPASGDAERDSTNVEKVGRGSKGMEGVSQRLLPYEKSYKITDIFGEGCWSKVYRAIEAAPDSPPTIPLSSLPPSPPTSPPNVKNVRSSHALAVKTPTGKEAHKILENEAQILTFLRSQANSAAHIVPFHGFETTSNTIVMSALEFNLDDYIKRYRPTQVSTKTMFDPILGIKVWIDLAEQLIDGLAFLHRNGCIHGDIKPANILLQRRQGTDIFDYEDPQPPSCQALYCDFSSSHILRPYSDSDSDPPEVPAVTTDYTAPELLRAFHQPKQPSSRTSSGSNAGLEPSARPRAVATVSSDVFALGVTLLSAAIGSSPYGPASPRKLSLVLEGQPLEFARRGDGFARVKPGKMVDEILKQAVCKDPEQRITSESWKTVLVSVRDALHV